MKRWALLVVGLYGLILAILCVPVLWLAFVGDVEFSEIIRGVFLEYGWVWCLVWIGVMMLAQAALLVVPVRMAGEAHVERRHVFWTFLAAFFLLLLMTAGMFLAVWETIENNEYFRGDEARTVWVAVVVGVWMFWALLMGFYTGNQPPKTLMGRLVKFLLAGSILELLVAVPAHIVARARNYCCAGFGTFWGLAAGLSVMLFAFGPAAFVLFVRRWQSYRRPRPAEKAD